MLHTFDGMDVFEEDVDWVGSAGLHDPWDHDPLTDFTYREAFGEGGRGGRGRKAARRSTSTRRTESSRNS
ncbi:unnamed protein product [Ectocarpus sp. CCAP 1310/34]|nr:unnamed protein product [Ectocarpus sp. CCAP 1310/34]